MAPYYESKVTVHIVLKNVKVLTKNNPEDITIADWKETLADHVVLHMKSRVDQGAAYEAIRDYKITDTQYHKEV